MGQQLHIRRAEVSEAPALAELCGALGHEVTPEAVASHLAAALDPSLRSVYVALEDGVPVGWLEVVARSALESGRWAEISGLVIAESRRSAGIGRALVERARAWAKAEGLLRLRVRTRVERAGAQGFYARVGFRLVKEQRVYEVDC